MKNKIIINFFLVLGVLTSSGQIKIEEGTYRSFDGRVINVYLIEGEYTVINIDKTEITYDKLKDTNTLIKVVNRCDDLYEFFKINLGYEPAGGNPNYKNKANVFFGPPSCGSGCGLIGAKGIECSGFNNIFYNLKYNLNINRDVIIGYEFGRNFFTLSSKILFPFDPSKNELNGGFAEAFANIMYTYAFDEAIKNPDERIFNETLLNPIWARSRYIGYINDTFATPYNTIAKEELIGIRDPNRGFDGWNYSTKSWDAYGILEGIVHTLGKENLFPKFFTELKKMPDVKTKEDAMSNIAKASSIAINRNLNSFFKNVLKFKLNKDAETFIEGLPPYQNKLIKYENRLWFISPFEKVRLNLRSVNYLTDNNTYRIYVGDSLISSSKHGNNELPYSILNNKNDIIIKCALVDVNNKIIDSFTTKLSKRNKINLLEFKDEWYAYYLSNATTKSYIDSSGNFVLRNLNDTLFDSGILYYNLIIPRNRVLKLSSQVKNIGKYTPGNVSNYSTVSYHSPGRFSGGQRVGYDIGQNDSTKYYEINFSDKSELFMESNNLFMLRIALSNDGKGLTSYFKNAILYDITDVDGDGISDFDDECPSVKSPIPPPNITRDSENNLVLSASTGITWYLDGVMLSDTTQKIKPKSNGIYTAKINQNGCASALSQGFNYLINSISNLSNDEYFKIFPNPSINDLNFEYQLHSSKDVYLSIIDINGTQVITNKKIQNNDKINISRLAKGTYALIIKDGVGNYIISKQIVKK